jgi:hypothetical protein
MFVLLRERKKESTILITLYLNLLTFSPTRLMTACKEGCSAEVQLRSPP